MKTIIKTKTSFAVPAGRYYLGDPCYVIRDEDWMPLLNSCDYFNQPIGEVGGFKILAFGTKHGDGCYQDQHGNEFGVDAGLIGLVPAGYRGQTSHGNKLVEFSSQFECWEDDGVLHFGDRIIDTNFEE